MGRFSDVSKIIITISNHPLELSISWGIPDAATITFKYEQVHLCTAKVLKWNDAYTSLDSIPFITSITINPWILFTIWIVSFSTW